MTPSRSNYDKARDATAAVFLRYDQAAMIRKFGLSHDADALYITFIARDYRVDRRTGAVTWASDTAHTASYNEAMSIYDVLCDSQPLCHLSHEWSTWPVSAPSRAAPCPRTAISSRTPAPGSPETPLRWIAPAAHWAVSPSQRATWPISCPCSPFCR